MARTYKALNPTPGTGIAEAIKTSFAGTAATVQLRNPTANTKYKPRYLRLVNTVVGASTTRSEALVVLDTGADRYSSGGSTLPPVCADISKVTPSSALVRCGALVMAAETANVRRIARAEPRTAIMVQFEEWVFAFGDEDHVFNTLSGANAQRMVVDVGPVIVGPGSEMIVHLWHPGNAATPPSWEVELAWDEGL